MIRRLLLDVILLSLVLLAPSAVSAVSDDAGGAFLCPPTAEDEMGPFYKPGAAQRNSVGNGYLLVGTVKSAADCEPIAGATIELWMTGPDGHYGDRWRATLPSADNGTYFFTSTVPTDYGRRRPHIHMRITAAGFETLVTQHYPLRDAGMGMFDLVLIPATDQ